MLPPAEYGGCAGETLVLPAIFHITNNGQDLAGKLASLYPRSVIERFTAARVSDLWPRHDSFIFIMAAGIVVRTLAPLIRDKRTDPAVVVLDEKGKFCVSLLSGHLGGANKMAEEIARFLGGDAVITTASDVDNLPSIDLWAREHDLAIENWDAVPRVATALLNERRLRVYTDIAIDLPPEFTRVDDPAESDMLITHRTRGVLVEEAGEGGAPSPAAHCPRVLLRPRNLIVGIGCNSGTSASEISDVIERTLEGKGLSPLSVHSIATLDRKGNEPGLVRYAHDRGLKIACFSPAELNMVQGVAKSDAAFRATGAHAVAEPAALLASGSTELCVAKQKSGNVTIAVAELRSAEGSGRSPAEKEAGPSVSRGAIPVAAAEDRRPAAESQGGRLYIVGTGPGGPEHITPRALAAIRESEVIVGYGTYLDLIRDLTADKQVVATGMTQEVARATKAVALARAGKTVAVISGGDPGIYAMAGLMFEVLRSEESEMVSKGPVTAPHSAAAQTVTHHRGLRVEVIPGISALNACAAKLGAPLMHDFVCVSLSDRLTPWQLIEKRLAAASEADFVIVLYNPRSKGRAAQIGRARDIIMRHRAQDTPVGIVRSAMRQDEGIIVTTLSSMLDHDIDMQTTVIVGNSHSFVWNGWMVTPRGYRV